MESNLSRKNFRNSELSLPRLGFGMMRLPVTSDGKVDYKTGREMVAKAMERRCNYFDTAYMYHDGESEVFAGEVLTAYPRDSYTLTDKMPVMMLQSESDVEKVFHEQLKRCKTEYFDFYFLHCLNAATWETAKKWKIYEFVEKQKQAGKVRHIGFSFHDSPEVLSGIAGFYPWELMQLQINYLDWDQYKSREQYQIAEKHNIPVMVMEPLRGGSLAVLNEKSAAILKKAAPEKSVASWGLRFAASLPLVQTVLSGMSAPDQLEDNLATMSPFEPLTDAERKVLDEALHAYRATLAIPCTACRYCMPCPKGVDIPRNFGAYNQFKATGNEWLFASALNSLGEAGPFSCVKCGRCVKKCPQMINIPDWLDKIIAARKAVTMEP